MFFEVYQDKAGEWRWRIKARNGKIIAVPGESFTRKTSAIRSIQGLLRTLQSPLYVAVRVIEND